MPLSITCARFLPLPDLSAPPLWSLCFTSLISLLPLCACICNEAYFSLRLQRSPVSLWGQLSPIKGWWSPWYCGTNHWEDHLPRHGKGKAQAGCCEGSWVCESTPLLIQSRDLIHFNPENPELVQQPQECPIGGWINSCPCWHSLELQAGSSTPVQGWYCQTDGEDWP